MDIDIELMYCPKCGDEYRTDFSFCAACEVELIDGATKIAQLQGNIKQRRTESISAEDSLVVIRKGRIFEMKQLQSLLQQDGIPSLIAAEGGDCIKGCCGPEVVLNVRLEDVEDAMVVLAGDFQRTTDLVSHDLRNVAAVFDTDSVEVTCPACGHRFPPTIPECPDCGLVLG